MAATTRANGLAVRPMAKEFCIIRTDQCVKVFGLTAIWIKKEDILCQREIITKEGGIWEIWREKELCLKIVKIMYMPGPL